MSASRAEAAPAARPLAYYGMALVVATEAALFATLIASYVYTRSRTPGPWPPDGIEAPKLAVPAVMTCFLIASSVTVYVAERGIRQGRRGRLVAGLGATIALGLGFLALQVFEYSEDLDRFRPSTDAYGSLFYTITSLHGTHVAVGLILLGWTLVHALRGRYTPERHTGVQVNGLYWHFVHGVWLVLFCVLYLGAHL
jgi:heme/copper-type cytochrome/quinol oxidase subunit 3